MKINCIHFLTVTLIMSCFSCSKKETISEVIQRGLSVATQQSLLLAKDLEKQEGALPRTFEDGTLKTSDYTAWTSGFFPGVLWFLYEDTMLEEFKKYAVLYTSRVEKAKDETSTHDLGFMLNCSFGNGYRITKDPKYLQVLKTGANSLATRFDERTSTIKSWGSTKKWQYPVIIDNMMNLEFLAFVAKETGEPRFIEIAEAHAQKTQVNHFRPDHSSYHIVSYDTITGKAHFKGTYQGYSDSSAWARGQAWGLYGYTMMYRETNNPEYLEQALNIALFIARHPNLPEDKIPYWDFDSPEIPNARCDASAAAVMASAFIELSSLDKSRDASKWLEIAKKQIRSLSSPKYLAEVGSNGYFILKHSVGNHNKNSEMDVPLSYADYYYVEALLRLKKLQN